MEIQSARALSFAPMEAALSAFDISNVPAIMLDEFGCVLRTNQTAQRMLGSDVFICQRRLRAAPQDEASASIEQFISS